MTLEQFKDNWIKKYFTNMSWSQYEDWCDDNALSTSEMLYDEVAKDFAKYHIEECVKSIIEKGAVELSKDWIRKEETIYPNQLIDSITVKLNKKSIEVAYPLKNIK